ncbi:hypothetical protein DFH94DRAFT_689203 [Russula ochroleuca]|uniref:Uncharacterized protein n=1 Tax=Russula ochroleuca TaxID=152965 RepID=A0A9P5N2L8_9AGAM|nr:hypothetical protein DFH94DRAFT_689203 [Russula ochroleuca]
MPRPVLVDLPLERFSQPVSDDMNLPNTRTGSKRSRSPSLARSIFSPAKRRILEQEGLFLPSQSHPSPSTTPHSLRSPHGSFLHAFDSPKRSMGPSPAGLGEILPSPPGDPHAFVLPPPRVSRRVSPRLSTTPPSRSLPTPSTPTRTSPRKTRSQTTPTPSTTPQSPSQRARHTSTPSSSPMPVPATTMIPREMPPPPDRRSAHYPGFDVHQDTHVALPCTRSKAHAKAEAARLQQQVQEGDSAAKENVRPKVVAVALLVPMPLTKGKVKGGDVVPRRSARLRTNNNGCVPSQKAIVVAPEVRGYGRRWRTLHESSLQF